MPVIKCTKCKAPLMFQRKVENQKKVCHVCGTINYMKSEEYNLDPGWLVFKTESGEELNLLKFKLKMGVNVIGRSKTCDVQIELPDGVTAEKISRRHCTLKIYEKKGSLKHLLQDGAIDLESPNKEKIKYSTNQTHLNGILLEPKDLVFAQNDYVIKMGNRDFVLKIPQSSTVKIEDKQAGMSKNSN